MYLWSLAYMLSRKGSSSHRCCFEEITSVVKAFFSDGGLQKRSESGETFFGLKVRQLMASLLCYDVNRELCVYVRVIVHSLLNTASITSTYVLLYAQIILTYARGYI